MFTRANRPTKRTRAFIVAASLHAVAIGALLVPWVKNQPSVIDVSGDFPVYYPPASAPQKGDGGTQAKADAKPRSTPKPEATPDTSADPTETPVEVAINTDLPPDDGGSTPGVPTGKEDSTCVGEHCTGTETTDCIGPNCGSMPTGQYYNVAIAPKPKFQPQPSYPATARLAGRTGEVVVEILVGIDGKVVEARLVSGEAPFDSSALAAVRRWRYEPLFVGGQAVMWKSKITLKFQLR